MGLFSSKEDPNKCSEGHRLLIILASLEDIAPTTPVPVTSIFGKVKREMENVGCRIDIGQLTEDLKKLARGKLVQQMANGYHLNQANGKSLVKEWNATPSHAAQLISDYF